MARAVEPTVQMGWAGDLYLLHSPGCGRGRLVYAKVLHARAKRMVVGATSKTTKAPGGAAVGGTRTTNRAAGMAELRASGQMYTTIGQVSWDGWPVGLPINLPKGPRELSMEIGSVGKFVPSNQVQRTPGSKMPGAVDDALLQMTIYRGLWRRRRMKGDSPRVDISAGEVPTAPLAEVAGTRVYDEMVKGGGHRLMRLGWESIPESAQWASHPPDLQGARDRTLVETVRKDLDPVSLA
ncbi:hypothetical protein CYMTET_19757 [Cymbomonas tetramitiformis]|uniref:Uncharacterized protein n=1 Tax=Cymbomonas tetramitiformis TaxID=36881 RepID=A0AAE0G5E1_9CHLO|nr:hypothetical protein CYMTET_19757 [Cymbomonas tetramitiformis]